MIARLDDIINPILLLLIIDNFLSFPPCLTPVTVRTVSTKYLFNSPATHTTQLAAQRSDL